MRAIYKMMWRKHCRKAGEHVCKISIFYLKCNDIKILTTHQVFIGCDILLSIKLYRTIAPQFLNNIYLLHVLYTIVVDYSSNSRDRRFVITIFHIDNIDGSNPMSVVPIYQYNMHNIYFIPELYHIQLLYNMVENYHRTIRRCIKYILEVVTTVLDCEGAENVWSADFIDDRSLRKSYLLGY